MVHIAKVFNDIDSPLVVVVLQICQSTSPQIVKNLDLRGMDPRRAQGGDDGVYVGRRAGFVLRSEVDESVRVWEAPLLELDNKEVGHYLAQNYSWPKNAWRNPRSRIGMKPGLCLETIDAGIKIMPIL